MNPPIELGFDPMKYLRLEGEKLYFYNGVHIGYVYKEVDGYYVVSWNESRNRGAYEGWFLLAVGAMLADMNMPWDVEVEYGLKQVSQDES